MFIYFVLVQQQQCASGCVILSPFCPFWFWKFILVWKRPWLSLSGVDPGLFSCAQVSPSELQTFAANYTSPEFFQANGITLAGTRYIFLSGTDRVLRAKKNKSGLHCMKTEKGESWFACSCFRPLDWFVSPLGDCSCGSVYLRGTHHPATSGQCGGEAGRIPHVSRLLEELKKAGKSQRREGEELDRMGRNADRARWCLRVLLWGSQRDGVSCFWVWLIHGRMQWSRDLLLSINTSSPSTDPLFCFEINSGKFPLPPSFLASFPFPVLDKTKNQQKKLKSIYFCPFLVSIICPKRELIGFCYEKEQKGRSIFSVSDFLWN